MAKKLFVRFAEQKDEKAVFDYYASHRHEYVVAREADVWKERIASGAVTIIEDEQGKIVASSISYPITDKNDAGQDVHRWTEIGSVRIALAGAGVFNALLATQVMRAYLLEAPEDRFVIEIVPENAHSKHVFKKAGVVDFDIPADLLAKVNETIAPEDKNAPADWFQLGIENMPHVATMLVDAVKNPKLVDKKTGEEYELDFSRCVIVQKFLPEIEKVAQADFGDAAKPDPKKGIRPTRDGIKP